MGRVAVESDGDVIVVVVVEGVGVKLALPF